MSLQIYKAKPNPAGKDKAGNYPKAEQLLGEWVDIKNNGTSEINLSGLTLCHTEFEPGCKPKPKPSIYWTASPGTKLKAGEIIRVHTGKSIYWALMKSQDATGVNHHAFAESGSFVLNNDCGDGLSIWWKRQDSWQKVDKASYRPYPPEGAVLIRSGGFLVPVTLGSLLSSI